MRDGEPMLNKEGVYVQSAYNGREGHQKKYTRSCDSQQDQDTYPLPVTVARSVQRPSRSAALAREELPTVPMFPFAS